MSERGFTLIEALVVLALMAILSGGVFVFLSDIQLQRGMLQDAASELEVAAMVFDRLEQDATHALAQHPQSGQAGVQGTHDAITILSRAAWIDAEAPARGVAGLWETRIEHDADAYELVMSTPHGEIVLSDRVERVLFTYHDGNSWRYSFDSVDRGGLPLAFECAIWFGDMPAEGEDEFGLLEPAMPDGLNDERTLEEELREMRQPDRIRTFAIPDAAPEQDGGRL